MRITSSLLAFIFIGVAAAGVIPEIAVRDSTVAGGKDGQRGAFPSRVTDHPVPSGKLGPAPVSRRDSPSDLSRPPLGTPSNVSDHPEPTGKHSRIPASRRDNPTDISHPPVSFSDLSDHPKPTGKHSRRAKPSDHPEPTEKHSRPAVSRRAKPTDIDSHIPAPRSSDSNDPHSHHPAARRTAQTGVPSLSTRAPSDGSDHPEPTGKPSRPPASHKARAFNPTIVHSVHPISRRASPTDINSYHHQGSPDHPKPSGLAP